jgi:small conductance mechanosensitive channel
MNYLENFYQRGLHWMIAHGPRIIVAIIVLLIAQMIIRLLRKWLKAIFNKSHIEPSVKTFLSNFIIVVLQVFVFVLLMKIIGVKMTVFASVVAGLTVAIGLALSGTMQNFASGVLILLLKPYKVGDNVVTQGQEGTVTSIQLFYTVILTFDNKTVIVPNSKLSNEIILNLSREGKRRFDIDLKFKYNIDFEKIKEVITNSFSSFSQVLQEPALRVGVSKLDTDSYQITVNAWGPAHGFEDAKLQINEKLMTDLKNAGLVGGG